MSVDHECKVLLYALEELPDTGVEIRLSDFGLHFEGILDGPVDHCERASLSLKVEMRGHNAEHLFRRSRA